MIYYKILLENFYCTFILFTFCSCTIRCSNSLLWFICIWKKYVRNSTRSVFLLRSHIHVSLSVSVTDTIIFQTRKKYLFCLDRCQVEWMGNSHWRFLKLELSNCRNDMTRKRSSLRIFKSLHEWLNTCRLKCVVDRCESLFWSIMNGRKTRLYLE